MNVSETVVVVLFLSILAFVSGLIGYEIKSSEGTTYNVNNGIFIEGIRGNSEDFVLLLKLIGDRNAIIRDCDFTGSKRTEQVVWTGSKEGK